jgi:hypothetical protein
MNIDKKYTYKGRNQTLDLDQPSEYGTPLQRGK